jgi:hypothetical protein
MSRGRGDGIGLDVENAEQLWAAVAITYLEDAEAAVRRAERRLERVDLTAMPDDWLRVMTVPGAVEGAIQAFLDLGGLVRESRGRRAVEICDMAGVGHGSLVARMEAIAKPILDVFKGPWWVQAIEVREKIIGVRPFVHISQKRRPRGPDGRLLPMKKARELEEEEHVFDDGPSF